MKRQLFFSVRLFGVLTLFLSLAQSNLQGSFTAEASSLKIANPILFVTQMPIPGNFTIGSVFDNHEATIMKVGRGGDLWIRYPDGTLKNLTQSAGFGTSGRQGANAIAVRDPSVHWSGTKALFSMVIGAPQNGQSTTYYWQIYEISGLGPSDTPVITKVRNQPANYNNVSPIYGTDDRIIFTSDRPRDGQRYLYPQMDEYEQVPTTTGLWSLNPASGDLLMLNHTPSGAFTPIVDSFGRVIYTRWDHLQRDQLADADAMGTGNYGTFNYADESANATHLNDRSEVYPEPRPSRSDLLAGTNLQGNTFNQFFPWQINEDGTGEETVNHVGRHELRGYVDGSFTNDPNVHDFNYIYTSRPNRNPINNFLQLKEDPLHPGVYVGVDASEFDTQASGQVISMAGAPTVNPDNMTVTYITPRDGAGTTDPPTAASSGHYRDPLPLSDGMLIAAHTDETRPDANDGSRSNPSSRYHFRLYTLKQSGNFWVPDQTLTPGAGISKAISFYDPDVLVSYSGPLWELQPVEVRARSRPARLTEQVPQIEQQVLAQAGVDLSQLQAYLRQNNLALLVSRNVTTRDGADHQQPFNLHIAGTGTQVLGASGKVYDVSFIQFFQADLIRGRTPSYPVPAGRRVLAEPMHDPAVKNPQLPNAPPGSVVLGSDGSMAAFVPARRAMSWQLTDSSGTGIVRERYWVTFQAGEVRVCASCHGVNERDQAGHPAATNPPQALNQLMQYWKTLVGPPPALQPGWHLVSIPFVAGASTSEALAGLPVTQAYAYDNQGGPAGSPARWRVYSPSLPAYANTLTHVAPTQALMLNLSASAIITPPATMPDATATMLQPGWNLVSLPASTSTTVGDAFGGLFPSQVDQIYVLRDGALQSASNTATILYPGEGLWVHAPPGSAPVTWPPSKPE